MESSRGECARTGEEEGMWVLYCDVIFIFFILTFRAVACLPLSFLFFFFSFSSISLFYLYFFHIYYHLISIDCLLLVRLHG